MLSTPYRDSFTFYHYMHYYYALVKLVFIVLFQLRATIKEIHLVLINK